MSDGGGLQLWIQPNGSKLWRLAYRFGGKQKTLYLGAYPTLSLADARSLREEAKRQLSLGADPNAVKKAKKAETAAAKTTFHDIAEEFLAKLVREGKAESTINRLRWTIKQAYPELGRQVLTDIKPVDVLNVLQKVEKRGRYEAAARLRSAIGRIFRYGIATARAEYDPTFALRGALATPKATPRPAITDPDELGVLLAAIDGYSGHAATQFALKLLPILFQRPGELRAAEWKEFNFASAVWTIPSARMKMRREHKVPLSKQALTLIIKLSHYSGNARYLFPGLRSDDRPISDNTLNAAFRRLGYSKNEVTAHGFRATACTLLNESGKWHPDAIERQLAHQEENKSRRAYLRGEHWEERVEMMQWWADYLDALKASRHSSRNGVSNTSNNKNHVPGQQSIQT